MLDTELIPAQEKDSRRLMIVIHGLGDSMDGYRWLPSALRIPSMNYLLVNGPDGYYGGFSWFDIYENRSPGIKRSRELLFTLLDDMRGKGFPTEQTILFGFSQGCVMTIEAGCRYPHLLAGLIGISGWPHEPVELIAQRSSVATQQKLLITHGLQDTLVPFTDAKKGVQVLKDAGFQIAWHEYRKAHTIIEDEIELFREFVTARFETK
ncbi:MAG: serine esterase [Verrucomicrobiales bacterium]|nr:serine esterase [Verrucomicrobiales bacterium]